MRNLSENEKAITLVSLVVTIIVLIILAGISINLILGQDGIITKAKQGSENYLVATNEEQQMLENIGKTMGNSISTNSYTTISNATDIPSDTYFYEEGTEGDENIVRYKKVNGEYFICNENGEVLEGAQPTDVTDKTLIDYTVATASNISAASAAFVKGRLLLGNGYDNATYYYQTNYNSGGSGLDFIHTLCANHILMSCYQYCTSDANANSHVKELDLSNIKSITFSTKYTLIPDGKVTLANIVVYNGVESKTASVSSSWNTRTVEFTQFPDAGNSTGYIRINCNQDAEALTVNYYIIGYETVDGKTYSYSS